MNPALGVSGTPSAQDVQNPTDAKPCGDINIAQNLETSTPIQADQDGKFCLPSLASQLVLADRKASLRLKWMHPQPATTLSQPTYSPMVFCTPLRRLVRNSSAPSSPLVSTALVVPAKTFVLHRSLRLRVREIAS
ncbi:hypothetical protein BJV77DRAFT_1039740 [Russula vinacea]|nr:hypothetical protein BJV77DRAFT_1039740 [Russula vinacea]